MLQLDHKKLDVYKFSIELVKDSYALTNEFPKYEIFGLTSQIRRSALSVPSNIAEGASRKSINDRKRFYQIARSSLVELDTQIELSIVLNYLKHSDIEKTNQLTNRIFAMLTKMT